MKILNDWHSYEPYFAVKTFWFDLSWFILLSLMTILVLPLSA